MVEAQIRFGDPASTWRVFCFVETVELIWPRRGRGIVMKFVVPMKSSHNSKPTNDLKPRKQAKLKSVEASHIAQRYMEVLRLRGQVYELEQKSGVGRPALSLFDQPGIA
jgi:hypothetical protein